MLLDCSAKCRTVRSMKPTCVSTRLSGSFSVEYHLPNGTCWSDKSIMKIFAISGPLFTVCSSYPIYCGGDNNLSRPSSSFIIRRSIPSTPEGVSSPRMTVPGVCNRLGQDGSFAGRLVSRISIWLSRTRRGTSSIIELTYLLEIAKNIGSGRGPTAGSRARILAAFSISSLVGLPMRNLSFDVRLEFVLPVLAFKTGGVNFFETHVAAEWSRRDTFLTSIVLGR